MDKDKSDRGRDGPGLRSLWHLAGYTQTIVDLDLPNEAPFGLTIDGEEVADWPKALAQSAASVGNYGGGAGNRA